jgi:hypothetical protein
LFEGLKNLGINTVLIGNVMSVLKVFDKDGMQTISLDEWYRIMG